MDIKDKKNILMLYSFSPSDMNFQTILMPKGIGQKFCQKKLVSWNHSYLILRSVTVSFPGSEAKVVTSSKIWFFSFFIVILHL